MRALVPAGPQSRRDLIAAPKRCATQNLSLRSSRGKIGARHPFLTSAGISARRQSPPLNPFPPCPYNYVRKMFHVEHFSEFGKAKPAAYR